MNWNLTFVALLHWKIFIDVKPTIPFSWGNGARCQCAKSTCKYGPLPLRSAAHKRTAVGERGAVAACLRGCLVEIQLFWALSERFLCEQTDFYNQKEKGFISPDLFLLSAPECQIKPGPHGVFDVWDVRKMSITYPLSDACDSHARSLVCWLKQNQCKKSIKSWGGIISSCQ